VASVASARVKRVSWGALVNYMRGEWDQGAHVTIVGPTKSGKTHIALALLELRSYAVVIATKRKDPLVQALHREGYEVVRDSLKRRITWTQDGEPLQAKIVLWPTVKDGSGILARKRVQAHVIGEALDWLDEVGGFTILLDECMYLADSLRLREQLGELWYSGRTQRISLIACAQRPVMIPRLAFSQARFLFLARTGDKADLERIRDIASVIPREIVEETVMGLDAGAHEFAFVDSEAGVIARVIAPPPEKRGR